ncbi:CynX/NimT family MFS transporter [Jeotgalibacillus sp. R-1-5s-1]|uniref:MFS transporter n=1 Tax=Jeotgalibacillus sp. R-1-5s-1 TaxID=2555897 RepID=UPI00352A8297
MNVRVWFLLLALFLVSINLRPSITSVAPLLETMQDTLGMSGTTASLLTTLPVLCMGLFAPFAVKISERTGLERGIFYSLLLITAATAFRGVFGNTGTLVVTAFLAGVGIGVAGPLVSGFIKQYFPTRPGVVSIYTVSMALGAGGAAGLSVPIYESAGQSLMFALAVWSVLGVLALVVWSRFAGKKKTDQVSERAPLPFKSGRAWLLTVFFGLMSSMFYTVTAWVAPIIQGMGYSSVTAGSMLTVFALIQIPVSLFLPGLVAKYGYLVPALLICSTLELIGVFTLIFDGSPLLAVVAIGLGAGGLFPLALMMPIIETETHQQASALSAMSQGGGYILAALGPLGVGAVYDQFNSFTPALYAMAVVVMLMAVMQILLGLTGKNLSVK